MIEGFIYGLIVGAALVAAAFVYLNCKKPAELDAAEDKIRRL